MHVVHPLLQRVAGILPWLGLLASLGMACVVTLVGVVAMPSFATLFGSVGQPLPWLTHAFSQAYLLAWLAPLLVGAGWYFRPTVAGRIVAGVFGLGAALLGAVSVIFAMYLPYFMMGSLV